jgi:ATPase subunit of ABC transporter with duplicated ATPase domains
VIRLDSVSKRFGQQVLFVDGSFATFRGEKVGLVGPNGSGKSTIFRLIMRDEQPDAGQVAVDRGTTIGYFSQDVGEMSDQSVVAATLDGAGPVSEAGKRLRELERELSDPAYADQMGSCSRISARRSRASRSSAVMRSTRGRARSWLAWVSRRR